MKRLFFIEWIGDTDDFTLTVNDDMLRVEQMDEDIWWWAVNIGDQEIASSYQISEDAAKSKAILRYNRYKKYGE